MSSTPPLSVISCHSSHCLPFKLSGVGSLLLSFKFFADVAGATLDLRKQILDLLIQSCRKNHVVLLRKRLVFVQLHADLGSKSLRMCFSKDSTGPDCYNYMRLN